MGQHDVAIRQVGSEAEIEAVRNLLREYIAWALSLSAFSDTAPTFQRVDEELATLPGIYSPPAGRLLLATHKGVPAGCVCLKPHHDTTCEVKRLYVDPAMRGLSIGRLLIERLLEEARQSGYERIVLDSHVTMTKAHGIYESAGFRRVPTPSDFPEHLREVAIFMELDLVKST